MARKALLIRAMRKPKFSTRSIHRCMRCGRKQGYMGDFNICRICFRELAENGDMPGIKRASW